MSRILSLRLIHAMHALTSIYPLKKAQVENIFWISFGNFSIYHEHKVLYIYLLLILKMLKITFNTIKGLCSY